MLAGSRAYELAHEAVELRVALAEPAAVVDAVRDVGELLWLELADVAEEVVLEYVAVQAGDAVYHVAGREAHIGHVDLAALDDGVAGNPGVVAVELGGELGAPAAVNLADNLEDARHEALHQALRPGLEGLGHYRVVRVGHAVADDVPGLIPAQAVLVHEDAHELGDNERRVRVVNVDNVVLGEGAHVAPGAAMVADDVLRGGGDEEVLLLEAQGLALHVVVGGVEHLGDDLGQGALLHALYVLALGEAVHIEAVGAVGLPEAQGVDLAAAEAGDEHIARDGEDGVVVLELGVAVAEVVPVLLDAAAEANLDRVLIAGDEPALGGALPVVGDLGLAAVDYPLAEHAELVAQGVAGGLDALSGHAVHIAGGEAAQAAVAEARVGLELKDVGGVAAHVLERADERVRDAEVEGVLHQAAAHEELHGEVVDLFIGRFRLFGGQEPAHNLAYDHGRGLEYLLVGGLPAGHAEVAAKLILERAVHLIPGNLSCCHAYLLRPRERSRGRRNKIRASAYRPARSACICGCGKPRPILYHTLLPLGSTNGSFGEPERVMSFETSQSLSAMM